MTESIDGISIVNEAIGQVIDVRVQAARTIVPGKIAAVTRTTQGEVDADFEAGIGLRSAGEEKADGIVPEAPVLYPGGGGFSMRWPLSIGDEVVSLVSDRSTQRWRQNKQVGQASATLSQHHHDLSDAMILPVRMTPPEQNPTNETQDWALFGPQGEAMRVAGTTGAITITRNGTPAATLELTAAGKIVLTPVPGQTVEAGGVLDLVLNNALITAIDAFITALVAAGSGPTYAGAGAAQGVWNGVKNTFATQVTKGA